MEQNPDHHPKLFDFETEPRGLDEPPLGFNDGSGITPEQLGALAKIYIGVTSVYAGLKILCFEGATSAHNALNRAHGKPPSGI